MRDQSTNINAGLFSKAYGGVKLVKIIDYDSKYDGKKDPDIFRRQLAQFNKEMLEKGKIQEILEKHKQTTKVKSFQKQLQQDQKHMNLQEQAWAKKNEDQQVAPLKLFHIFDDLSQNEKSRQTHTITASQDRYEEIHSNRARSMLNITPLSPSTPFSKKRQVEMLRLKNTMEWLQESNCNQEVYKANADLLVQKQSNRNKIHNHLEKRRKASLKAYEQDFHSIEKADQKYVDAERLRIQHATKQRYEDERRIDNHQMAKMIRVDPVSPSSLNQNFFPNASPTRSLKKSLIKQRRFNQSTSFKHKKI